MQRGDGMGIWVSVGRFAYDRRRTGVAWSIQDRPSAMALRRGLLDAWLVRVCLPVDIPRASSFGAFPVWGREVALHRASQGDTGRALRGGRHMRCRYARGRHFISARLVGISSASRG